MFNQFKMGIILLIIFANTLLGQHSKPDTLVALYSNIKIKLDGHLNEDCWQKAKAIENFTQREQNEGEPATEKTKIAVIYNTNEIYFGIWCYDSEADKISAQKMSRDFSWGSDDNVEIMLSPFNDDRNGYLFVTNPNGAMADVWVGDEGKDWNKDWNGVWDAAVSRNETGWFAEIVIPFSTLKFTKDSNQIWGINFERNIRRKKEQVLWQGWSRIYDVEKISQSGKLSGINNIKQGTKIEIYPYLLAGTQFSDEKPENSLKTGGELNVDISPTLKLNFTVNTDFAQVESDRKQINLSRFSVYYPEKRQFFLKGQSYYNFNLGSARLFYSRKVGIEDNNIVPILGGVRLFGKLGRSNIGIMSMQTDEKDNIPGSNLSIIRLKQDIFKQSSMGILATQKYSDKGYNRVYGTDFSYSTSNVFKDKNLILNGHIALSETTNFDDSDMNSNTMAYDVSLSYPNDLIEYDLGYRSIEKGFNPEMGFVNRDNYDVLYTELQFNPRFKNMPVFRNLIFKPIDIDYYINHESKKTESISYEWRPLGFVTKSGEFLEFNVQHEFDRPEEDFTLIDTVKVSAGEYWDSHFEILGATFSGRKISSFFIINIGEFYTGNRQEYFLATSFNINKHLNIILDIERNYIQLPQATFVTSEIGGRIDYAFTPKLQSGLFAQWNNDADQIFLNYRINWIPKTGSYFYFVINQEYNTSDQLKLMRTTIIGKLIWRFAL